MRDENMAGEGPATVDPPAEGFEIFSDPSYYDMYCVRPVGSRDFNATLHFSDRRQAVHASHVVGHWISEAKKS